MDPEISLNPSDNDLFVDDSTGVPETAPSPIISHRQQTRPRSTIYDPRGSRHLSSDHSNVIDPSPSNNPRGRSRSRHPRDIVPPHAVLPPARDPAARTTAKTRVTLLLHADTPTAPVHPAFPEAGSHPT
ncbi:hypothetical protein VZT92_014772 [Zoarces viviparus]|uniref:Uncharacterized protein n=1 Tax=Zoarces viviparus TaxID=48416 RepID=A0AAW1F114_ZOAVI